MDEKKKVVRLGERRPTDQTPRELITFLGYVDENPYSETGAKERWIDTRRLSPR